MAVEKASINELLKSAARTGSKLFRNNTGTGWVGKMVRKGADVLVKDARPLHAGLCVGSSDVIGWHPVVVTQEMVGRTVAVFVAIEVKEGKTPLTTDQATFIRVVNECGGIAFEAREEPDTPSEAVAVMKMKSALWHLTS